MLPADNHVHSEFSWDTGVNASMEETCRRAVEIGLPSVAFTEHVDFTEWGDHDHPPTAGAAVDAPAEIVERQRVHAVDIDGYLASVERCRGLFPQLRVLTGIEAGEPHHFAGSVAAVLAQGQFQRVLGSLHSVVHNGRLVYADRLFRDLPADVVLRDYFEELVRLINVDHHLVTVVGEAGHLHLSVNHQINAGGRLVLAVDRLTFTVFEDG